MAYVNSDWDQKTTDSLRLSSLLLYIRELRDRVDVNTTENNFTVSSGHLIKHLESMEEKRDELQAKVNGGIARGHVLGLGRDR